MVRGPRGAPMAAGGEKSGDLYAVLGLKKECSDAELRNAYKKLAMRWHPDKCSGLGNAKRMEEAKEKFQQIQGAYSVLSDSSKRFLYDVGVYDSDDDENGMEDFLGEMAQMMSQTKPSENGNETFEELQQLFVEMFQSDLGSGFGRRRPGGAHGSDGHDRASSSSSSSSSPSPPGPPLSSNGGGSGGSNNGNKRGSSAMSSAKAKTDEFDPSSGGGFCFGRNDSGQSSNGRGGGNGKRRNGRKQKVSSKHDVSSLDAEISA